MNGSGSSTAAEIPAKQKITFGVLGAVSSLVLYIPEYFLIENLLHNVLGVRFPPGDDMNDDILLVGCFPFAILAGILLGLKGGSRMYTSGAGYFDLIFYPVLFSGIGAFIVACLTAVFMFG